MFTVNSIQSALAAGGVGTYVEIQSAPGVPSGEPARLVIPAVEAIDDSIRVIGNAGEIAAARAVVASMEVLDGAAVEGNALVTTSIQFVIKTDGEDEE